MVMAVNELLDINPVQSHVSALPYNLILSSVDSAEFALLVGAVSGSWLPAQIMIGFLREQRGGISIVGNLLLPISLTVVFAVVVMALLMIFGKSTRRLFRSSRMRGS